MKRLNTRLDALESRSSDDLSHADKLLLVGLLAKRDAMFWPWRCTIDSKVAYVEIFERQREYLAGVAGIAIKADGRNEWKTAHATRQRLIASGMITATHSSGQVTSVFLTPRGEAVARALVGARLHDCRSARLTYIKLLLVRKTTGCDMVRESVLFQRPCVGSPVDWNDCTELILPFITAGMVRPVSDTVGRVLYRPVEGIEFPPEFELSIESSDEFDEHYLKVFDDETRMLEGIESRFPNSLHIPCPASGGPPHYEEIKP